MQGQAHRHTDTALTAKGRLTVCVIESATTVQNASTTVKNSKNNKFRLQQMVGSSDGGSGLRRLCALAISASTFVSLPPAAGAVRRIQAPENRPGVVDS
jgi:hypothetical protein